MKGWREGVDEGREIGKEINSAPHETECTWRMREKERGK